MPYDPNKTLELLRIVGAFANHPTGEFIVALADQLKEAEKEIALAVGAKLKAESDANRYAAELETMQSTVRRMREASEVPKEEVKAPAPKPKRAGKVAQVIELPKAPAEPVAPPPTEPANVEQPKRQRKAKA